MVTETRGGTAPRPTDAPPARVPSSRRNGKAGQYSKEAMRYVVLIGLSLLYAFPFIWMVGTSITPADEVLSRARPIFPAHPDFANYKEALTVLPFATFLRNTLMVAFGATLGQTLSAASVAYAFARIRFPFRDGLFVLVLSTMMLPAQVTMIPNFVLFTLPKWIDSLKPLIVPAFFGGGAFFIFLLRQFFMTIPTELDEAAKIDGASSFQVFRTVIMPLSKPALTTVALFAFINHWNDFLGPLIYTQSMEKKTLAVGLQAFKSLHGTEYHLLMAASVAVLVPILLIFFAAQKYFVEGIVTSGMKV